MKSIKTILSLLFVVAFWGCSKNNSICSECSHSKNDCKDENLPKESSTGYNFAYEQNKIRWFSFNPNNGNQLIVYKENTGSLPQLIKYDLSTGTKQILLEQQLLYSPHWGKMGYILFTSMSAQIWRMDEDGANMKLLTPNGSYYATAWNKKGDKFLADNVVTINNSAHANSVTISADGIALDTIQYIGLGDGMQWNNGNYVCLPGIDAVSYLDLDSKSNIQIPVTTHNYTILGAAWSADNNSIIFTTVRQIKSVDIHTKKETCLLCACTNDLLLFPQQQPNSNRIFFVKDHWKSLGGAGPIIQVTSTLYCINEDGTDGKEVALPN